MPNYYRKRWEGHIRGLQLPLAAWNSLHDEGITSLDQLKAVADRLERFVGIGSKMAYVIREELARVTVAETQPADNV
ncbi:hypothetical protein [Microvirga ossetica]|nr:hypothetical protein [Microvirga ossetica]